MKQRDHSDTSNISQLFTQSPSVNEISRPFHPKIENQLKKFAMSTASFIKILSSHLAIQRYNKNISFINNERSEREERDIKIKPKISKIKVQIGLSFDSGRKANKTASLFVVSFLWRFCRRVSCLALVTHQLLVMSKRKDE